LIRHKKIPAYTRFTVETVENGYFGCAAYVLKPDGI
jgi:hypothetical protein